jgi:hypothetical protein
MTEHTPVQAVTVASLRENYLSLSRLRDDVSRRLRDLLAKEYGVAVGDTVEYPEGQAIGERWQMVVTSISMAMERVGPEAKTPGNVVLIVKGTMADPPAAEASMPWNPATCTVVKKGEPA